VVEIGRGYNGIWQAQGDRVKGWGKHGRLSAKAEGGMKHFSYLVPHLPQPSTPHAKSCMEKIRDMLSPPTPERTIELPIEREPGEDREELSA
jgi:hypothetical protein